MLTGATDMSALRVRGVQAYGFGPLVDEAESGLAARMPTTNACPSAPSKNWPSSCGARCWKWLRRSSRL